MANHYLVAGLGNITHPLTKHSLGHYVIDGLASRLSIPLHSERLGHIGTGDITVGKETFKLTLFKPKALMNISGPPVVQTLRRTAINPDRLIVLHDSLDHKPRAVSPKFAGSAGGHNGVRSIIGALGNNANFHRLRLGVGRGHGSHDRSDVSNFVLGPISEEERAFWGEPGIGLVWGATMRILEGGLRKGR